MQDEYKVLDHGLINVIEVMGDDMSIVQSARVSYGKGTKTVREDEKLIRYLMKHGHMSPFEMVEIKFYIKMPIFVARQWIRYRTANVNEYSGRYSVMNEDYYLPEAENIKSQSTTNKQGRGEQLGDDVCKITRDVIKRSSESALAEYHRLLELGVSRELARVILPVNIYTEIYWKNDLRNILSFLQQRNSEHAQYEIREYARALELIIKDRFPIVYKAYLEFMKTTPVTPAISINQKKEKLKFNF